MRDICLDDGVDGLQGQLVVAAVHGVIHGAQLALHYLLRRRERFGGRALARGRHAAASAGRDRSSCRSGLGRREGSELSDDGQNKEREEK
jgi:hypothetical protein